VTTYTEALAERDATIRRLQTFLRISRLMNAESNRARLIGKINEEVRGHLDADRFTVFFHDSDADQLYSFIGSGLEPGEIRIPSSQGIAGAVFQSGETLCLADAYDDPRFNREVDCRTGYRTRSLLSLPVTNRSGARIGVVQALNKRSDNGRFTDEDVDFLREFVAQVSDLLGLMLHKEELARQHAALQEAISRLKVYDYLIGDKTVTKVAMRWTRTLHIWVSVIASAALLVMAFTGVFVVHGGPVWWKVLMYKLHTGEVIFPDRAFLYSDLAGVALGVATLTGIILWLYPLVTRRLRHRLEEQQRHDAHDG